MNMLDRYIARTLLSAIALVLGVLLVLGLVFVFIGEQGDVGTGHYGMLDALSYSLLQMPDFALQSFPAAVLMGGLLGIGVLARSHELTIMRASGMSKLRLGRSVLVCALILITVSLAIGEFMAQPMSQLGDQQKASAKYSNASYSGFGGAWIRDGDTIINVQGRSDIGQFGGMMVFELTPDNRLASVGRADRATPNGQKSWRLDGYNESRFVDDSVVSQHLPQRALNTAAGADFLRLTGADTDELSLRSLYTAIRYLRSNDLDSSAYVFAFWARVARTVGILAAIVFALPFGFGSMRSTSLSARTTLGFALGIIYFFLQRLVESGAQVFSLNPLLLAWIPTMLLGLAAMTLLWRLR